MKSVSIAAGLILALIVVYSPALTGQLLWDDAGHITQPALQSLPGLWRIWTDLGATQQYYPLTHTVFWLAHALWGDNTLGYHVLNVLLHATSSVLIYKLLSKLAVPGALLAALLFAFHPFQVESVAWISELKNALSTPLYLAATLVYLDFDETRSRRSYWLALALFTLALAAKTVTATLPAALLVVLWWKRGRIRMRGDVVPLLPFFAVAIGAGLLTAYVERHFIGAQGPGFELSFAERVLVAGRAICFYAFKLIAPLKLSFVYERWRLDPGDAMQWAYPVVVVVVAVLLFLLRRKSRAPLALFLLFCGALFPALGFVDVYPFRYSFVADHFAYLASIPFLVAAAVLLERVPKRAGYVLLLPLAFLSWRQAHNYASAETLWRATIESSPRAGMPHNNLAYLLLNDGRAEEARREFMIALELQPEIAETHMNVGRLLIGEGQLEAGERELREAIRLNARLADAHSNLGVALLRMNRRDEAVQEFTAAFELDPQHREARLNLAALHQQTGVSYAQAGRMEQALTEFETAITFTPDDAVLYYNAGTALLALNRVSEAISKLETALRLRPDFEEAEMNLEAARAR